MNPETHSTSCFAKPTTVTGPSTSSNAEFSPKAGSSDDFEPLDGSSPKSPLKKTPPPVVPLSRFALAARAFSAKITSISKTSHSTDKVPAAIATHSDICSIHWGRCQVASAPDGIPSDKPIHGRRCQEMSAADGAPSDKHKRCPKHGRRCQKASVADGTPSDKPLCQEKINEPSVKPKLCPKHGRRCQEASAVDGIPSEKRKLCPKHGPRCQKAPAVDGTPSDRRKLYPKHGRRCQKTSAADGTPSDKRKHCPKQGCRCHKASVAYGTLSNKRKLCPKYGRRCQEVSAADGTSSVKRKLCPNNGRRCQKASAADGTPSNKRKLYPKHGRRCQITSVADRTPSKIRELYPKHGHHYQVSAANAKPDKLNLSPKHGRRRQEVSADYATPSDKPRVCLKQVRYCQDLSAATATVSVKLFNAKVSFGHKGHLANATGPNVVLQPSTKCGRSKTQSCIKGVRPASRVGRACIFIAGAEHTITREAVMPDNVNVTVFYHLMGNLFINLKDILNKIFKPSCVSPRKRRSSGAGNLSKNAYKKVKKIII